MLDLPFVGDAQPHAAPSPVSKELLLGIKVFYAVFDVLYTLSVTAL
jgi:hypothetical protein